MPIFVSFKSLSVRHQIGIAGGVLAILCASLFALYFFYFSTSYGVLFSRLRPADAAAIVSELDHKKMPYRLSDGGGTILVPENAIDTTRLAVMNEDLPIKGVTGFELFNKSDMGLTEFAQKINYQRALQGELARTIMSLEGVDSARVHLALTEPTIFKADRIPPKASVAITMHPGASLSDAQVRGVQRLVASAVPELDVADVAVLDERGAVVSADAAAPATPTSAYGQEKLAIESFHAARIKEALERTYPHDLIGVTVSTEFDTQSKNASETDQSSPILTGTGRNRPLLITLTSRASLSDSVRADVRAIVSTAIGFSSELGDVITFAEVAPVAATSSSMAKINPPLLMAPTVVDSGSSPWKDQLWLVFTGIAVVALAFLLGWRWAQRGRRLKQRAYIEQFNMLLEQGGRDVTE